jgi:CheY-like chemotaxis protein
MYLHTQVKEMVSLLNASISKKALIVYDFEKNAQPIEADATQIRQIIMNLVVNASEAIGDKSGAITLRTGTIHCDREYLDQTYLNDELQEGDYSYVEVADTGVGMDKDIIAKVFDPFFTTKFTGRGLGLAASLGIVRGHKGAVKVTSEPGVGTTFRILFPEARGEVYSDESQPGFIPQAKYTEKKVLLVDDEDTVRMVGQKLIETLGPEVVTARDGKEALDIFREDPDKFDCIILDLNMPRMDGVECLSKMKGVKRDITVFITSGYNEHDFMENFDDAGLSGFIQKPFQLKTLYSALQTVFD